MSIHNKIFTAIQLPATLFTVIKNISAQRFFLQKHVKEILSAASINNDGSLDDSDFKKITGYYGLAVPAILGEAFCALHNKKMSPEERWASTCQGAMTGLFDDFFDKSYLADKDIERILLDENLPAKKSNEKLFDVFYKLALKHVPDKNNMQQTLLSVYQAQVESKKQTNELIREKEILDITCLKGGTSLLFYRTAFLPAPSKQEEALVYKLGGLMQLSNDIFDVYKDSRNGVNTLVTQASHIKNIRDLVKQQLESCYVSAYQIGIPKRSVKQFLSILTTGIFSRVFVCLDQLQKNENTTANKFLVHQYSRKQLICDMDTKKNMLRAAAYQIQLMR